MSVCVRERERENACVHKRRELEKRGGKNFEKKKKKKLGQGLFISLPSASHSPIAREPRQSILTIGLDVKTNHFPNEVVLKSDYANVYLAMCIFLPFMCAYKSIIFYAYVLRLGKNSLSLTHTHAHTHTHTLTHSHSHTHTHWCTFIQLSYTFLPVSFVLQEEYIC